jgi:putative cell wall-binding protein
VWELVADGSGGASGQLLSLSNDGITACETSASADEALRQYVLRADVSCLSGVPRALRFGASLAYDENINDDDYDTPSDQAPDDDLTDAVASSGSPFVHRIAGQDRVATAIALSTDSFDGGQAESAVLASAATYPDAIAGGPLAVARGGPLLLTPIDHLDPRVASELERSLAPGSDVLVLGGSGAISEDVVSSVRDLGFHPQRIAGANRFETAVAIADEIGDHTLVAIADGRSFREALVAGAAAAARGGVVVLTDGGTLPGPTDDFLAHDPTRHVAIGTAATAAPGAERITAGSVAELSQKVLDRLLPDVGMIAIASDATFADALAGAPHLASLGGGLLLTDGAQLSTPVADELRARSDGLREIAIYGGTAAVSAGVEDAIVTASGG